MEPHKDWDCSGLSRCIKLSTPSEARNVGYFLEVAVFLAGFAAAGFFLVDLAAAGFAAGAFLAAAGFFFGRAMEPPETGRLAMVPSEARQRGCVSNYCQLTHRVCG